MKIKFCTPILEEKAGRIKQNLPFPQRSLHPSLLESRYPLQIKASRFEERRNPQQICKLHDPGGGWESQPITYEAASEILELIKQRRLIDSLEWLGDRGFCAEAALLLLSWLKGGVR